MTFASDRKLHLNSAKERTSSPARAMGRTRRPPSAHTGLPALPLRRALVEEGIHALAEILAHIGAQDQKPGFPPFSAFSRDLRTYERVARERYRTLLVRCRFSR